VTKDSELNGSNHSLMLYKVKLQKVNPLYNVLTDCSLAPGGVDFLSPKALW